MTRRKMDGSLMKLRHGGFSKGINAMKHVFVILPSFRTNAWIEAVACGAVLGFA